MIRVALEELSLFFIPFALFAVLLVLQRRKVLDLEHWSRSAFGLTLAGLLFVIGGFLYTGLFGERHTGRYVPPHMEDGRPVPGSFR